MDSKLLFTAWSQFADKKLQEVGAFIRSFAVHPGFVKTKLWNAASLSEKMNLTQRLFFEKSETVAENIAYVALSSDFKNSGGIFLVNNNVVEPHPLCQDEYFQNSLWMYSCKLLQLEDNLLCPINEEESILDDDNAQLNYNDKNLILEGEDDEELCTQSSSSCPDCKMLSNQFSPNPLNNGFPITDCTEPFVSCNGHFWKHSFHISFNFRILKCFSSSPSSKDLKDREAEAGFCYKPYYEYFINTLFNHWTLNKRGLKYLETVSIFILRNIGRFNSYFKIFKKA